LGVGGGKVLSDAIKKIQKSHSSHAGDIVAGDDEMPRRLKGVAERCGKALNPKYDALVVATMALCDDQNQNIQRVIFITTESWEDWYSDHIRCCKSVKDSQEWLATQVVGGAYLETCGRQVSFMQDREKLKWAGFRTDFAGVHVDDKDMYIDTIFAEDDLARYLGTYQLELLILRLRWGMWFLRGWPGQQIGFLNEEVGPSYIDEFLYDWDVFDKLKEKACDTFSREIVSGHVFNLMTNVQLRGIIDVDGRGSPAFLGHVSQRTLRPVSSLPCEHALRRDRRKEQDQMHTAMSNRVKYITPIKARVLTKEHRFNEVDVATLPVWTRGEDAKLPKDLFDGCRRDASLPFKNILSYVAKADFPTCTGDMHCVQHCNLEFSEFAVLNDCVGSMAHCFVSCLVRGAKLLIRELDGVVPDPRYWSFALRDTPGTLSNLWPAASKAVRAKTPGGEFTKTVYYPEFRTDRSRKVNWLYMLDPRKFEAMTYEWVSPFRLLLDTGFDGGLGVIAMATCEGQPLLVICAKNAFFILTKTELIALARWLGYVVPSGATLYDVLMILIRGILVISEEDALQIIKHRLALTSKDNLKNKCVETQDVRVHIY